MLSQLRQTIANEIAAHYLNLRRKGYEKKLILQQLSERYGVTKDWMYKYCDIQASELYAGDDFNIKNLIP